MPTPRNPYEAPPVEAGRPTVPRYASRKEAFRAGFSSGMKRGFVGMLIVIGTFVGITAVTTIGQKDGLVESFRADPATGVAIGITLFFVAIMLALPVALYMGVRTAARRGPR